MKATVTSKGQITIPQAIRQRLKLQAGSVLEFDERADHLKARKCADPARMRSVIGIAKKVLAGRSVLDWLSEVRGPVELPPTRKRR
ncbi:MAG: AbrB/MazE/SpoVT family DNA-binding domain-containing protein [Verrucomicrobia bacterium]|nr:AbrB/MazE/SpoVT family DNA-binding domain-containing protein [Verrucomicrobiota bacterium]